jgi:hypothetical protein
MDFKRSIWTNYMNFLTNIHFTVVAISFKITLC